MDDGKAHLAPSIATIGDRVLLDYGVDTAKLTVRRVSHDFNNLIAVVRGYAGILQGRPGLDEDIKELAHLIDQAGSELAALTDRLAQFASNQVYECSWFNLNSVITDFLKESRDQVPQGIEVETQLGSLMPDIWGDARLIGDLCQKLWQNAIDAMPHGGRLSLKTSTQHATGVGDSGKTSTQHASGVEDNGQNTTLHASVVEDNGQNTTLHANDVGDYGMAAAVNVQDKYHTSGRGPATYLLLRMTDTGEGMDERTRASMLQPFFTTKSGKGRGLGATLVYEAVKFHGGQIYVSSELGKGTTVDIHLPVADPDG